MKKQLKRNIFQIAHQLAKERMDKMDIFKPLLVDKPQNSKKAIAPYKIDL
jgi:hypothetical protein